MVFKDEITENENNSWTQKVKYAPLKEHSEKILKCEAHYDNNNEVQEPKKMAEIVLSFTEEHFEKMANNSKISVADNEIAETEVGIESIAIIIVFSIVAICLAIFGMWRKKLCCFKSWQPRPTEEVDAENPKV